MRNDVATRTQSGGYYYLSNCWQLVRPWSAAQDDVAIYTICAPGEHLCGRPLGELYQRTLAATVAHGFIEKHCHGQVGLCKTTTKSVTDGGHTRIAGADLHLVMLFTESRVLQSHGLGVSRAASGCEASFGST